MSSVTGNKVQENAYKQLSFFHSANHLPIDELDGSKIAPEKAAEMLRKRGVDISVERKPPSKPALFVSPVRNSFA